MKHGTASTHSYEKGPLAKDCGQPLEQPLQPASKGAQSQSYNHVDLNSARSLNGPGNKQSPGPPERNAGCQHTGVSLMRRSICDVLSTEEWLQMASRWQQLKNALSTTLTQSDPRALEARSGRGPQPGIRRARLLTRPPNRPLGLLLSESYCKLRLWQC